MTSTYTPLLRLTLPTTGELIGTWGNTINTGITTLIENTLAGTVTVTHDDSANYTLTVLNGVTDQARYAYLSITGTLTAARNVVCPAVSKFYFVKNNTTGGYAVTFKTSGGTGISINNGDTAYLYCDGTNVIHALTNSAVGGTKFSVDATTVTWNGNPTHSGNHTFSGNLIVQGNTTIGNTSLDTFTFYPQYFTPQSNLVFNCTNNSYSVITTSGDITLQSGVSGNIYINAQFSSGQVNINNTTYSSITSIGPSSGTGGYVEIHGNNSNGVKINSGTPNSPLFVGSSAVFWNGDPTFNGTITGAFMPARITSVLSKGKVFATSGGFTCNAGTAGDFYYVYNDSIASITITNGTTTMRLAGTTTTGNRTLAAHGFAYIWYNSSTEIIVGGDGVT